MRDYSDILSCVDLSQVPFLIPKTAQSLNGIETAAIATLLFDLHRDHSLASNWRALSHPLTIDHLSLKDRARWNDTE